MPAASVSQNSTRRCQTNGEGLLPDIRHKCHKPSSLDRFGDRVLTGRRAARFSTAYDPAVTIHQLRKQFDIFVIDIHRPRPLAIDQKRIPLFDLRLNPRSFSCEFLACGRSS